MSPLPKTIRQRLEAMAAEVLLALFRALPVDMASALGGAMARRIGPFLKVSQVARDNLRRAFPDKDDRQIEALVAAVWDNLGRVVAEFPHIHTLIADRVEVVGLEYIHQMRDDGLPGLFVSAHLANWEMAGALAKREGVDLSLVYRAANNPWVERIYRHNRAGSPQIPKGPEGARQIINTLKQGGHVAMLVDQKMNDGIPVPFFGRDAMTATAPVRFAHRFKCPVAMVQIERLQGAHFRMTVFPPTTLTDTGDIHADTRAVMTEINHLIEGWVRQHPGQWLWLHRRWPD